LQYFFIFIASVDPLSKNKSWIIIQKCRNFCKQLTLPGRTVQQLPFFKTVRLYTVDMMFSRTWLGKCSTVHNSFVSYCLLNIIWNSAFIAPNQKNINRKFKITFKLFLNVMKVANCRNYILKPGHSIFQVKFLKTSYPQCITGQFWKPEVAVLSDQVRLVACRNFDIFGWLSVIYSLKVDQLKQ
jgi:hypothetical protein